MRRFLISTLICSVSACAFLGVAYAGDVIGGDKPAPFSFGLRDIQTDRDNPDDDGNKNTGKNDKKTTTKTPEEPGSSQAKTKNKNARPINKVEKKSQRSVTAGNGRMNSQTFSTGQKSGSGGGHR
jgi:hypothetical protein